MVRLKGYSVQMHYNEASNFNSSMVRLKVISDTINMVIYRYFNSSMVRLKGSDSFIKLSQKLKFQFQYGTIKG